MSAPNQPVGPELFAIVAMTQNRVIGKGGTLPWRLPADLAHFKRHSLGKPNIMGRKVWDSLGARPLPQRPNIVLTRNTDFTAQGALVAHTPEQALAIAQTQAKVTDSVAIIGGAEIYQLYLPLLSRIELTLIHTELEGDTYFPELGPQWQLVSQQARPADERNPYDMTFMTLRRKE